MSYRLLALITFPKRKLFYEINNLPIHKKSNYVHVKCTLENSLFLQKNGTITETYSEKYSQLNYNGSNFKILFIYKEPVDPMQGFYIAL